MRKFLCISFCVSAMLTFALASRQEDDGVLDKIKAGLEYATNYLETAKDIADLVAKSLDRNQEKRRGEGEDGKKSETFGPSNVVSAFFRLLGLDSQKITAIAVNSVIFLAQMISALFNLKATKESPARSLEDESDVSSWNPAKLITESKNERIQSLVEQARDENLPVRLIERIDEVGFACVRLLVCKISPVIRAAQNFLKNEDRGGSSRMTSWLPSRDEFEENSDECENTHTDCGLFS
ncbi:hypothetical protein WN48_09729 [Eufriesea mexicana]|uniref:Uncharacterized protein n=1 Tax=Eufriesea mexicana TaxID=516756 RepID=A0A310S733_9HYME|nr:hypothetical protein WN48_09729 [Eufriesea mexicana]